MKSDRYDELALKYSMNFVTKAQLRRYVGFKVITGEEFTEITGEVY